MSSDQPSWDSESDDTPSAAPLPIIRREAAPAKRVVAPVETDEEDQEDALGLWVEDDAAWEDEPGQDSELLEEAAFPEGPAQDDDEELPDPSALFLQMQSATENLEADTEPEPELDALPDPNELFLRMQSSHEPTYDEKDLPDPQALFLQMQGRREPVDDEQDLPDPNALFLQMQGRQEPVDDEQDLPDPNALFLQMQGRQEPVDDEQDLPDPNALFLQMQGNLGQVADHRPAELNNEPSPLFLRRHPENGLERSPSEFVPDHDPSELLLEIPLPYSAFPVDHGESDPSELFLEIPLPSLDVETAREVWNPDEPILDIPLPGSDIRMEQDEWEPSEAFFEIPLPSSPYATDDEKWEPDEPLLDFPPPRSDFPTEEEKWEPDQAPFEIPLPRSASRVDEGQSEDDLFLDIPLPTSTLAADDELPEPDALFRQMQALSRSTSAEAEDILPDPDALFLEMQAREALEQSDPFAVDDDLPDASALFTQMQAREFPLSPDARAETSDLDLDDDWFPPLPEADAARPLEGLKVEEKASLFSRIKAKFTREKKPEVAPASTHDASIAGAVALPDPAELFRRMQQEEEDALLGEGSDSEAPLPTPSELFRRLQRGETDFPEGLPALPDLDAFRAELEAEERSRLDADLLDDLEGPERFADTISDLAFNTGTFFEAPPDTGSIHKAPKHRQDKALPPPARLFVDDEPLPSMLGGKPASSSSGETVRVPPPAPRTWKDESEDELLVVPKPIKRKSSSTAVMPKEPPPFTSAAGLSERLAKFRARRRAMSRHALSIFTRQVAAMLKAGIGLHQAVAFCAESDPESAPVLEDVCGRIESGYSLSAALKEHSESFDAVFVGLVHAGELSGRLNEILARLADMMEREINLRKKLISVVTYPLMLMAVSILGTLGFIFFVLPQLTPLFLDLKVELPWPTKVLLGLREVLLPGAIALVVAAIAMLVSRKPLAAYIKANPSLERRLAYFPLALPVLGPVYDKMVTARVLYSLSTMLEVGVTMNQALARAEGTSGNAYVGYRLARARMDLADGATVTECFEVNKVFPDTALYLIAAGEESARLVEMFAYIAHHFDEEVEQSMNAAAGLLEPLIMVVMGFIVGFIVIASALPTVQLLQRFGG